MDAKQKSADANADTADDGANAIAIVVLIKKKKTREQKNGKRIVWVNPWLQRRYKLGIFSNLLFEF